MDIARTGCAHAGSQARLASDALRCRQLEIKQLKVNHDAREELLYLGLRLQMGIKR